MRDCTQHHRHTWQQAPEARIAGNIKTGICLLFILAAYAFTSNQDYEDAVAMEAAQAAPKASSEYAPGELLLAASHQQGGAK